MQLDNIHKQVNMIGKQHSTNKKRTTDRKHEHHRKRQKIAGQLRTTTATEQERLSNDETKNRRSIIKLLKQHSPDSYGKVGNQSRLVRTRYSKRSNNGLLQTKTNQELSSKRQTDRRSITEHQRPNKRLTGCRQR